MPKAYSDDLRLRAVWLHVFLGYNIEDTSGMLAMSPSSVKRFKKKFVCTGEVVAKKTGRPLDLIGMHLREELVMMEAMLEHPEKTLTEIVREIMTVFGNRFQVSTVCRYFQRNGVTRKRLKKVARQQSELANINFVWILVSYMQRCLSFLMKVDFEEVFVYKTVERKCKVAKAAYLDPNDDEDATTNGDVFLQFVNEKLVPNLLPFNGANPRSVVIMDNAAIHHSQRVVDAINASGALLIFLPPYSPNLMPCEGVIALAKSWIRENDLVWEQCDEPENMVFEAFMQIADEDITNYIRHSEYL
ncbi:uncharacterized protein LOC113672937 [Pocillopora damicornis]|uniref:uncharacterized protein LOC113672937 n=1 Tax=Pocillopora damicornis TaxID=46731 RepID=UPI000F5516EB|nr:uncharacterized protein LOC113672937 [Pocillopora damicornis]